MKRFFLLIAWLISWPAYGDESVPLLYTRGTIVITRAAALTSPLPWQKPEEAAASAGLPIDVEIRDAALIYNQKGWYNLSSPSEQSGVLLVFSSPTLAPIISSAQYAPLDVLMIDDKGTITTILPNLMLADLGEDIYPQKPILAFLFLKGGLCEKLSIQPGDDVDYKIFKKPPTMLTAPAPAAPPEPPKPLVPAPPAP